MRVAVFIAVSISLFTNSLGAQSMPDTTGLPPAVTKYIADLSGTIANLNLEKARFEAELKTHKEEKEVL